MAILGAVLLVSLLMAIPAITVQADEETPTFNTTIPNYMYDFTNDVTLTTFTHVYHMSVEVKDGYYTFIQTDLDAGTWLETPTAAVNDCQYMSITYRTTVSGPVSFYYNTAENQDTFAQSWIWNGSGDWVTEVIPMTQWGAIEDGVKFGYLRFDFFESASNGDSVDVKNIAFFATEEDALGFNYDEYIAKLEWEYDHPEETEAPTEPADTKEPETSAPDVTEAPTQEVTEAPTQEVTEAPETIPESNISSEAPVTEPITEAPTEENDSDIGIIIVTIVFVTVVFGILVALTFIKKKKA